MRTEHVTTLAVATLLAAPLLLGGCQAQEKGVMDGNAPPMQHMQGLGQQMMQKAKSAQPTGSGPAGQPAPPSAPR